MTYFGKSLSASQRFVCLVCMLFFLGARHAVHAARRGDLHCDCKLLYAQAIGPGPGAVCLGGSLCDGSH
jgi:hypothetical protein